MTELMEPDLAEALDVAHIIYPNVEVGEKALTLCGLEWKVTVQWSDIPSDHAICRGCVDMSLAMLTESVETTAQAVRYAQFLTEDAKFLATALTPDNSLVLGTLEAAKKYDELQAMKAAKKADKQEAKAQRKFEKALVDNQKDRLPDVPDQVYSDAVEVRMLRAKGLSWEAVADVLDMPVDECKGSLIIAFGKPKKGKKKKG